MDFCVCYFFKSQHINIRVRIEIPAFGTPSRQRFLNSLSSTTTFHHHILFDIFKTTFQSTKLPNKTTDMSCLCSGKVCYCPLHSVQNNVQTIVHRQNKSSPEVLNQICHSREVSCDINPPPLSQSELLPTSEQKAEHSPRSETLLQTSERFGNILPYLDAYTIHSKHPTTMEAMRSKKTAPENIANNKTLLPRYSTAISEESNCAPSASSDNVHPHAQQVESISNSYPNSDQDDRDLNDIVTIRRSFSSNSSAMSTTRTAVENVTMDDMEAQSDDLTSSPISFQRYNLPSLSGLKLIRSKLLRAFMTILKINSFEIEGSRRKQKGKHGVIVSYPVPTNGYASFITQAEQYRKTAKMFHLQGGELETTLKLYERALDILVIHHCCDGKYFGKVVFEYGIILANANRHSEAAKCFLHADSLGIDRDEYFRNVD